MKKKILFILTIFIYTVLPLLCEERLSPVHERWLDEVHPIITKTEKEIFLKLKTEEERNRFINVFWKQRDPMPDISQNEFKKEYMKRIQFADGNFGRETSKRGSQTERGYFYLLLGPPLERQFFTTHSKLVPLELWYYRGEEKYGLPPYFYLIFYQPQGLGEYRLYHPGVEGPEKLLTPSVYNRSLNRNQAFSLMKEISGELANASLSYLPGEKALGLSSFSSETIISGVHSLAEKKFSDAYAHSYLSYKDYVETEYTHSYIESAYKVKVFRNFNQFFIHWAIEPKKINFAFYEGKYYAVFQLILRIEDTQGNPILEKEEEIPLKITPDQYRKHERQLFSFQNVLPVIPGNYRFFFLLKNKTAKDFTSFDLELFIPPEESGPLLSSLLLYHSQKAQGERKRGEFKAFSFNGKQFLVNTQNKFLPTEEMGLYCQVYNLGTSIKDSEYSVLSEIYPLNETTAVKTERKPLKEVLDSESEEINLGPFSLDSLKSGYYRVELSLLDEAGHGFLTERENFILLSQPYPVVPWVYSKKHNPFINSDQLFLLSTQYYMAKRYEDAKLCLEKALRMKDEPRTKLLLAKALYALQKYKESLAVVFPVYQVLKKREAAKVIALNYVGLKDCSSALVYLEKLMEEAAEVSVLNLAAECYLSLNQPEKALPLLQKSLELKPSQARARDLERRAKYLIKHF